MASSSAFARIAALARDSARAAMLALGSSWLRGKVGTATTGSFRQLSRGGDHASGITGDAG
jgi:hypothetical protein